MGNGEESFCGSLPESARFYAKIMICRCGADHESAIADSDNQIVQKLEILLRCLLANYKLLNVVLVPPTDVKRWWSQGSEGAPN